MLLTGGPGTGKTTVVKGIISSYEKLFKPKKKLSRERRYFNSTNRTSC
ncbi:AAA family ATPase [Piscibacillus salipiscarius]|nr:AAA family ATPase [Piscibacillus salipiscarius]